MPINKMIASTFIDTELPKDDFIKVISKYDSNVIAPLRFNIAPDVYGCQPEIYNFSEDARIYNDFTDAILLKEIWNHSKANNKPILTLVRHDMYIRSPTVAEAKIHLRNTLRTEEGENLERFRWKGNPEFDGLLIRDIDGAVYDYPSNHRWEKSLLHTAVVPMPPDSDFCSVLMPLFDIIDYLADTVHCNALNSQSKIVTAGYILFSVGPSKVTYCPVSELNFRDGYLDPVSAAEAKIIVRSNSRDLLEERLNRVNFFKVETKGYDSKTIDNSLSSKDILDTHTIKN